MLISLLGGSAYGADFCAVTAADAAIRVDNILAIALGYSFNGALRRASSAHDAGV